MPFPNRLVVQPDLQTLAKYNVKGVFEEVNAPYLDEYLNMQSDYVEHEDYHLYIQEIHRRVRLTRVKHVTVG